jgi:hypothetical protein
MVAGMSSGSVISRSLGWIEDAFDGSYDQPERHHQPQQVEGDENE